MVGYTSERNASHSCDTLCATLKESYLNIYTALTILATMSVSAVTAECKSRTIFQPAEKTEDLAAKHDDARLVDWTRSYELSVFHHEIPVDIDQVLRDFDPLNDRRILHAVN